jgi:hypothetical protein
MANLAAQQDASSSFAAEAVLDTIPEDRPSNEWMPRNIGLQRWWNVMTLRSTSTSRSESSSQGGGGGSSNSGGGGNNGGGVSVPSDEAEIQDQSSEEQVTGTEISATGQQTAPVVSIRQHGRTYRVSVALIAVVVALMVGASVGIYFIVDSTRGGDEPAESMDHPPAADIPATPEGGADASPQTEEDKAEINGLLESISGDALKDSNSPQSMARTWLLDEDPAQVSIRADGEERVTQRYCLGTFYFALNGTSWRTNGFLTPRHECDWTGITCDDAQLDTALNLSGLALRGSIPPEIAELSLLEQIVLSNNTISGDIPSRIWGLPFLYMINLGENELTGTISSFVWDLPFLEHLDLQSNRLSGTLPGLPDTVPPLRHIWLQENLLTGSIPSSLSKLVNLETVVVYDNKFNSSLDVQWSDMTRLFYVDASWNQLSGPLPDLAVATSLQFIYLNNNTLTGPLDEKLGGLGHLQELWLQSNSLTGEIPARWSEMESLTTLLLHNNALNGSVPEAVCNLTMTGSLAVFETDCNYEVTCDCCTACH